jgi:GTPase
MTLSPRPKAVLVGVRLPEVSPEAFEASMNELERLVTTLGYDAVGRIAQNREHIEVAAVVGEGKLKELVRLARGASYAEPADADDDDADDGEPEVALVAVDHEITPSQARNIEKATGSQVLDRTGVIIEIFHRHAKSREAKLQVEIARLKYVAPRLRESPGGKERQRGRGAGEAAVELDRRKVRDRIAELKEELEKLTKEQGTRRTLRKQARRVALVGYTNAGKSSLMRALTGSQVYVENKLFATLDTTVRLLQPETKPTILVSDTVGFINHLPHDLVASFQSTLDEALEASVILHVVDGSDENFVSQLEVTERVLGEIGALTVPRLIILNKRDLVSEDQQSRIARLYPGSHWVSAGNLDDVARLHKVIVTHFESTYEEAAFVVPYSKQAIVSEMHEAGKVVSTDYVEEGTAVVVRAAAAELARFRALLA